MQNEIKSLEKEVCLYAVSKSDFNAAKNASEILIQYIRDKKISAESFTSDPVCIALHCAMIICYAKPFGRNNPKMELQIQALVPYLNQDQQKLHTELIEMRDQSIAHSDHEIRRVEVFPPIMEDESCSLAIKSRSFSPEKVLEIHTLILHMEKTLDYLYSGKIMLLYIEKGKPSKPFSINPTG